MSAAGYQHDSVHELHEQLLLADWRRQTADMYEEVRRSRSPAEAHERWRARRDRLFQTHPESPLAAQDPLAKSGLPYWPYDSRWRFAVTMSRAADPVTHDVQTAPGEITRLRQLGWLDLPERVGGRLALWWLDQYAGGLFLPFRDLTARSSTYGAGRYLLDTAKGADLGFDGALLVIDFNFSYHPSCRYDSAWQCPLAPPENVLDVAIEAGEKLSAD